VISWKINAKERIASFYMIKIFVTIFGRMDHVNGEITAEKNT
jgi:hypothetical protein